MLDPYVCTIYFGDFENQDVGLTDPFEEEHKLSVNLLF